MESVSRWRLRLVAFEVRMCRLNACPRLNLPEAVFLKRLAAPLCVFSFGITISLFYNTTSRTRPVLGPRNFYHFLGNLAGLLTRSRRRPRSRARLLRRLRLLWRPWGRALLCLRAVGLRRMRLRWGL